MLNKLKLNYICMKGGVTQICSLRVSARCVRGVCAGETKEEGGSVEES